MTGDRQEEVSRSEPRLDFIQDFTLKSMRCKQDKWQRMIVSDDVRRFVLDFIEKGTNCKIFSSPNSMGSMKKDRKAIFFWSE